MKNFVQEYYYYILFSSGDGCAGERWAVYPQHILPKCGRPRCSYYVPQDSTTTRRCHAIHDTRGIIVRSMYVGRYVIESTRASLAF